MFGTKIRAVSQPRATSWVACQAEERIISAKEESGGVVLFSQELGSSTSTSISTFPLLPSKALYGSARFNSTGKKLAVQTERQMFVVAFNHSSDIEFSRVDLERSKVTYIVRSDEDHPCFRGKRKWGFSGNFDEQLDPLTGNKRECFAGVFVEELEGRFKLFKGQNESWYGKCCFTQDWSDEVEWPLCVNISKDMKTLSVGSNFVECVDPVSFSGHEYDKGIVDFCWHPASPDLLCILDTLGTLRTYSASSTYRNPELDLNLGSSDFPGEFVRITFGDAASQDLWQRLTCYALRRNGSIVMICPVGQPHQVVVPLHDLKAIQDSLQDDVSKNSHAAIEVWRRDALAYIEAIGEREFVSVTFPTPSVQTLCGPPGSPDERYAPYEKSAPSFAFDFCLTPLDEHQIIHRTWTCGRMDIVVWSQASVRPTWPNSLMRPPTRHLALEDEPSSNFKRKGANLKGKMSRFVDDHAAYSTEAKLTTIKCADVFSRSNHIVQAFVYPSKAHPYTFALVESGSGEVILMRSLWAETGSRSGDVELAISMLDSIPTNPFKHACAWYFNDSVGYGMSYKTRSDEVTFIDVMKYLRIWTASAKIKKAIASSGRERAMDMITTDYSKGLEEIQRDLNSDLHRVENVRGALQNFMKAIPAEIGSIVPNEPPEDSHQTIAVMTWLDEYYERLARTPNCLIDQLQALEAGLIAATQRQKEKINGQVEAVKLALEELHTMEGDRHAIRDAILVCEELFTMVSARTSGLRQKVQRLVKTNTETVKQLVGTKSRLESLRDQVESSKNAVLKLMKELEQRRQKDVQNHEHEKLLPESRDESMCADYEILGSIVSRLTHRLMVAEDYIKSKGVAEPVMLIGFEDNTAQSLDEFEGQWKNLFADGEKIRVFISERIMTQRVQSKERRNLEQVFQTNVGAYLKSMPFVVKRNKDQPPATLVLLRSDVVARQLDSCSIALTLPDGSRGEKLIEVNPIVGDDGDRVQGIRDAVFTFVIDNTDATKVEEVKWALDGFLSTVSSFGGNLLN